ncbi:GGDEF domain-containing protein [Bacillus solitudinis]|uniref:GGDEF domain-containing protein n=1 Tax=Bacillus solitudinis TaxID=2014074 RepID=UPI000C239B2A|nr:diguanylate cyclase [Bacillus solitudinis]
MVLNMIAGVTVLTSFIFVGGYIVRDNPIYEQSSFKTRWLISILSGTVGILLMLYGSYFGEVLIDLRYLPVLLSALLFGFQSAVITSIIIGGFRFFFIGGGYSSLIGFITIVILGIGSGLIGYYLKGLGVRKWIILVVYGGVIGNITLFILGMGITVHLVYTFHYSAGSFLLYFCLSYIHDSNVLYRKAKREALTDHLTGLGNMRAFTGLIEDNVLNSGNESYSLLILDIDHFKAINDTYGHLAGDEVLTNFARLMMKGSRTKDKLFRNGGEEFAVAMPNCSKEEALDIAEKIRRIVEDNTFHVLNRDISITTSIGVATTEDGAVPFKELYRKADQALYKAKQSGRNKVCV